MMDNKGNLLQGIVLFIVFITLLVKVSFDLYEYLEIKIMPTAHAYLVPSPESDGNFEIVYKINGISYYKIIPDAVKDLFRNKEYIIVHYHPDIYEQIYILSGLRPVFFLSVFFCVITGLGSVYFLLSDRKQ